MVMDTVELAALESDARLRHVFSEIVLAVARSKRIVAVTGAGISVSSGIPDFRSADGLYNLVKERYPNVVVKGKDLFSAGLFREAATASVFYAFAASLKRAVDNAHPSRTHKFLVTLASKQKLLRSYTQNIDGMEARAGLGDAPAIGKRKPQPHNVQLHGDIHRVRCTVCSTDIPCTSLHMDAFDSGVPPPCPDCTQRSDARRARSARALKIGTLRPAIVLYDENHPQGDALGTIANADCGRRPDLLVVMGTSLKVHGIKQLVRDFAKVTRASTPAATKATSESSTGVKRPPPRIIFVNRTPPPAEWTNIFDVWVQGDTDDFVERVETGWRKARPADWETQTTLDATVVKNEPKPKVQRPTVSNMRPKEAQKPKAIIATIAKAKPAVVPLVIDKEESLSDDEFVPSASQEPPPSSPASSVRSTLSSVPSSPSSPSTPSKRRKAGMHYPGIQGSPTPARPVRGAPVLNGNDSDEQSDDTDDFEAEVELGYSPSKKRAVLVTTGGRTSVNGTSSSGVCKMLFDVTNSPVSKKSETTQDDERDTFDLFGSPMKMSSASTRPLSTFSPTTGNPRLQGSPTQASPLRTKGQRLANTNGSKVKGTSLVNTDRSKTSNNKVSFSPKRTRNSSQRVVNGQVSLPKMMEVPRPKTK